MPMDPQLFVEMHEFYSDKFTQEELEIYLSEEESKITLRGFRDLLGFGFLAKNISSISGTKNNLKVTDLLISNLELLRELCAPLEQGGFVFTPQRIFLK